jgi:hypothetical protein
MAKSAVSSSTTDIMRSLSASLRDTSAIESCAPCAAMYATRGGGALALLGRLASSCACIACTSALRMWPSSAIVQTADGVSASAVPSAAACSSTHSHSLIQLASMYSS